MAAKGAVDQEALPEVHVVAGVLHDADGRVLIAQRPVGRHMAGRWEFPGGKLAPGEPPLAGLKRELTEELGIGVLAARPLLRLHHTYHDRRVLLDFWTVTEFDGVPASHDGQALEWVAPDNLPAHDLLEADRPVIAALRLPPVAIAVSGLDELERRARASAVPHAWLWRPEEDLNLLSAHNRLRALRRAGHKVLAVGDEVESAMLAAATAADGVLLRWDGEDLSVDSSGLVLVGVLCESESDAIDAVRAGAQFLVVAPGGGPLSAGRLAALCDTVGVPVYSGWFDDARRLESVREAGACGVVLGPITHSDA